MNTKRIEKIEKKKGAIITKQDIENLVQEETGNVIVKKD